MRQATIGRPGTGPRGAVDVLVRACASVPSAIETELAVCGPQRVRTAGCAVSSSLEIDLTAEERDEFEAGIQKYVEAARRAESGRVGSQRTRRSSGSLLSDAEKPVARLWIQEQYKEREIGDRGRLPRDLEQA